MQNDKIINLDDNSFEAAINGELPVLVDFWASWCAPCRMIAPYLDDFADSYAGQITICKLNIDDNPDTPQKYGVKAIPTLLIFKDGQVIGRVQGAQPKTIIQRVIENAL